MRHFSGHFVKIGKLYSNLSNFRKAKIWIRILSKLKNWIKLIIQIPNSNQEPPLSFKSPNQSSKDMEVLCTFKINLKSQRLDHGSIIVRELNPNNDQDSKLQSWTSSPYQSTKSGFKGLQRFLHLQNQFIETKCRWKVYQSSKNLNYNSDANPNLKPPPSPKALDQILMEMKVLCILKINLDSQPLEKGVIKAKEKSKSR